MNEEHQSIAIVWEIKGFLNEFKENTMQKFAEVKEIVSEANTNALIAQKKAEEAQKAALEAKANSDKIVFRSGVIGTTFSFLFLGFVWAVEHGTKLLSIVR